MYSDDVISVQQGFPQCSSRSWCQRLCGRKRRGSKRGKRNIFRSRYTPDFSCRLASAAHFLTYKMADSYKFLSLYMVCTICCTQLDTLWLKKEIKKQTCDWQQETRCCLWPGAKRWGHGREGQLGDCPPLNVQKANYWYVNDRHLSTSNGDAVLHHRVVTQRLHGV